MVEEQRRERNGGKKENGEDCHKEDGRKIK